MNEARKQKKLEELTFKLSMDPEVVAQREAEAAAKLKAEAEAEKKRIEEEREKRLREEERLKEERLKTEEENRAAENQPVESAVETPEMSEEKTNGDQETSQGENTEKADS